MEHREEIFFQQKGALLELAELTAYAEEKFHIQEQHKWADFPGFSVLSDPDTGKWLALLMRQWDSDTGTELQRCDIKCGRQILSEMREPYLTLPFRMKGMKWAGVIFDRRTKPEVIFRLFDRAVYSEKQSSFTITLENAPAGPSILPADTRLPASGAPLSLPEENVPGQIRDMRRLYEYRSNSFAQKCRNFYRQGRFMENYEDNAPWSGTYRHYFPTYHDLNTRQLRGYFTWRTRLRKGDFQPAPASFAYLYLYELLNGIGTSSPEESLRKMQEFQAGFLDSGTGDPDIGKNLRRWMLEYAVLHGMPPSRAREYTNPAMMQRDAFLTALKEPETHTDEELFSALCAFAGRKLEQSPVIRKDRQRGAHLFAALWRTASGMYLQKGQSLFTACFGEQKTFPWHPLANAVYWEEHIHADTDYALNACRVYHCRGGFWLEERYDPLYFDRKRLQGLLREADRRFRRHLKTDHYLRENPGEAWAAPYAEAVLSAWMQEEARAARPAVSIDFSGLEQIRRDAGATRDSLLTESELGESFQREPEGQRPEAPVPEEEASGPPSDVSGLLDDLHRPILLALLRGESPEPYMQSHHLMPSVAADTINEAFFEETGDSILACDGQTLTLVEDYREDILKILGGKTDEG
ncbi:MAG TPA: TerB N-terminal domain-containing protein [Candidatus Scatomonas pullistercoris]|uniref:TerB N-terminal domain-containing protein n=1 Tax=Candidatus Scatomonas pullistercoris TaxID=2840920 RepID=A0A9D1T9V6_9FIRM|nr:TerB N-terminal domain-containing protein [Candidatus Scatomonas pullistercoris]